MRVTYWKTIFRICTNELSCILKIVRVPKTSVLPHPLDKMATCLGQDGHMPGTRRPPAWGKTATCLGQDGHRSGTRRPPAWDKTATGLGPDYVHFEEDLRPPPAPTYYTYIYFLPSLQTFRAPLHTSLVHGRVRTHFAFEFS